MRRRDLFRGAAALAVVTTLAPLLPPAAALEVDVDDVVWSASTGKLSMWVRVSDELLADSPAALRAYVGRRIEDLLVARTEHDFINGTAHVLVELS